MNKVWFCIGIGAYCGASAVVVAEDKRSACAMAKLDHRNVKNFLKKNKVSFYVCGCELLPLKPKNKKVGVLAWYHWEE